jgi:glycosyltransferase involved in cell wall biosynthesis
MNNRLLVISRISHTKKDQKVFFQNNDGPYLEEISSLFAKVVVLSPLLNNELLNERLNLSHKVKSLNIQVVDYPKYINENKLNKKKKLFKDLFRLIRFIKQSDVVYVFMPSIASFCGIFFSKIMGKKIIFYSGFPWEYTKSSKLIRKVLRFLDLIGARLCNIVLLNNCILARKIDSKKYVEHTRPLSPSLYLNKKNNKKHSYLYQGVLKNDGKICLLSVGHIMWRKNYKLQIDALSNLSKLLGNKMCIELNIVGSISDETCYQEIKSEIKKLPNNVMVNFMGYLEKDSLHKLYFKSDALIFSSESEGFPRVFWESMQFNLPIISLRLGGDAYYEVKNFSDSIEFCDRSSHELSKSIYLTIFNKKKKDRMIKEANKYLELKLSETPFEQFERMMKKFIKT